MNNGRPVDRNLGLDLVRVTEAAALNAARWMGRGDKNAADGAAVDGMRAVLNSLDLDGLVVIGEGAKDEAPMLYIGEQVGSGNAPHVDIAVDPIDGTRLLSLGMPNALAVVAVAERGTMLSSPDISYMDKIAVGAEAAGRIDIKAPVRENLRRIAAAKGVKINDLTICVLDRPRHETLIAQIRKTGARIKLIPDGDVAGAVMAATPGTGIDALFGIGGAPEAVVAACAIKCLGGEIQCVRHPRNEAEQAIAKEQEISLTDVLGLNDLVASENVFFAATGITDGELVRGVHFFSDGASTSSIVMRSLTGTIRRIDATHRLDKLRLLSGLQFD
ncbi:MAG TPA: class II fructose-bisphosphatase [Thermomicrobiales bacterium]|nr:class II fructose-bisphosphatase [Thermomicrobiales bacterium]